jgi:hypothetical protein
MPPNRMPPQAKRTLSFRQSENRLQYRAPTIVSTRQCTSIDLGFSMNERKIPNIQHALLTVAA